MKRFILALGVLLLMGCATGEYDPYAAERWQRAGAAMSGFSNQMNQMTGQAPQLENNRCDMTQDQFGNWHSYCHP